MRPTMVAIANRSTARTMTRMLRRALLLTAIVCASGRSATESYHERSEVKAEGEATTEVSACAKALDALELDDGGVWNDISFAVHRSGNPEPCGLTPKVSLEAIQTAMASTQGACDGHEMNKFQMESFLTTLLISQLGPSECGSADNFTAPDGMEGFCDMGPDRTVIQNDHTNLVPVAGGSLPCRFYTREGLRISSLSVLSDLAAKAKCNDEDQTCSTALHIHAVPAGRMFMFAPSYVGEKFYIDHVTDLFDQPLEDPIELEVISVEPRVFEIYNFFSKDDAQQLIDKALAETSETHKLHRSTTGATGGSVYKKRTSENAWDTHGKQAKEIKRRCMKFLGFDEYWESNTDGLQILRYQNAQAYVPHADYLSSTTENHNYDTAGVGTNRFATILLYMSDVEMGGETLFQKAWPVDVQKEDRIELKEALRQLRESGVGDGLLEEGSWEEEMTAMCRTRLAITPRKGRAVLFYSQRPNGQEDKTVLHGGCPVLEGTKWAANLWVWSGPRPEFEFAPKKFPEKEDDKPKGPKQLYAVFKNTGKDPAFTEKTELYYDEDGFFGKLGPNDPPIAVNTYTGHRWNVKVDGKVLKSFVVTQAEKQTFEV